MKLAIECKPYTDETLTSWIIRNSIANGTDPKSFALSVFQTHSTWYKDIDRYIDAKQLKQLYDVSSLSKQKIIDLTLAKLIEKNTDKDLSNPLKWSFIIPLGIKGSIQTSGLYFCPDCLRHNNPYIRKQWKLAWVISCQIHKKLLLVQCQNCNQVFSPHLISYDYPYIRFCTNCGFDLCSLQTEPVSNEALSFQKRLTDIAFNQDSMQGFPLVASNSTELFLTLEKLLSFMKYAYSHAKYNYLFKYLNIDKKHFFKSGNNKTFARLDVKDRECLLIIVSKLFQLQLHEIIELFQKIDLSKTTFLKTSVHQSKTVNFIAKNLSAKKMSKPPRKVFKKIEPKSKEEVDLLFKGIEVYLK